MCGGGGGSGGGDSAGMGMDDSVADQSATSGDTSSVGDDPSGPNDPGVGPGNDPGNDPTGNTSGTTTQVSSVEVDPGYPSVGLSQAAINSAKTDQSKSKDSQSYFSSTTVPDAMDFNMANSVAAQDVRDKAKKGSLFRDPTNPLSYAINALSKMGPQNTINSLNMGQVPSYNTAGQITGTTGQGFGANQTMGYIGGLPGNQPGVPGGLNTNPTVGGNVDNSFEGGNDSDELIRRRMAGEIVPEDDVLPPLSDELASNYLQDPYYLYSGIGNQYQPYGYAQNTLVDLLRTRNMTQPQQRAANLGLFGNPGDFS